MSLQQELSSWFAPKPPTKDDDRKSNNEIDEDDIPPVPKIGDNPPSVPKLSFQPNRNDSGPPRPTILAFLRHCGCPFAEKTFLNLRETARNHRGPAQDDQDASIDFIAISHSSAAATETWLQSLPQAGSEPGNLRVIVDEELEVYRAWGLGVAGYGHVLSPRALGEVWRLGSEEGIWNRPTESGSRWQVSGFFAVGGLEGKGEGEAGMVVKWGRAAERADDVPDFEEGVRALGR
ncbi:hypothetical protein NU219Hw_g2220t1 [Hortaea werneckii]